MLDAESIKGNYYERAMIEEYAGHDVSRQFYRSERGGLTKELEGSGIENNYADFGLAPGAYAVAKTIISALIGSISAPLKFSNQQKMLNQMSKRGWTKSDFQAALKTNGIQTQGKKGPATRYIHHKTDKSVVRDNTTGEIFHVGGEGFKY